MTLYRHELRRGRTGLIIWTAALSVMLAVCVLLFPLMEGAMAGLEAMIEGMGEFGEMMSTETSALTDFTGYIAVECSEMLGLGGAIFAAILGISALAKEEREHTAEFLLTHPISRTRVAGEKLAAVLTELVILNLGTSLMVVLSTLLIGEEARWGTLALLALAYLLMQICVAGVCFGLSALVKRVPALLGIGVALGLYFLYAASGIVRQTRFLRYLTPFSIPDTNRILEQNALPGLCLLSTAAIAVACVVFAFLRYRRKDIAA